MERVDGGNLPLPHFQSSEELKISATRRGKSRVVVSFQMLPHRVAGTRQISVPLQTGLNQLPATFVAVHADVIGHYQVTPRQMNFGLVHGAATRRATISSADTKALEKLKVSNLPSGFRATLMRKGNDSVLTLQCSGAKSRKIVNSAIFLSTGDSRENQVKIPVLAVCSAT